MCTTPELGHFAPSHPFSPLFTPRHSTPLIPTPPQTLQISDVAPEVALAREQLRKAGRDASAGALKDRLPVMILHSHPLDVTSVSEDEKNQHWR